MNMFGMSLSIPFPVALHAHVRVLPALPVLIRPPPSRFSGVAAKKAAATPKPIIAALRAISSPHHHRYAISLLARMRAFGSIQQSRNRAGFRRRHMTEGLPSAARRPGTQQFAARSDLQDSADSRDPSHSHLAVSSSAAEAVRLFRFRSDCDAFDIAMRHHGLNWRPREFWWVLHCRPVQLLLGTISARVSALRGTGIARGQCGGALIPRPSPGSPRLLPDLRSRVLTDNVPTSASVASLCISSIYRKLLRLNRQRKTCR